MEKRSGYAENVEKYWIKYKARNINLSYTLVYTGKVMENR